MNLKTSLSIFCLVGALSCGAVSIDQAVLSETFDADALGVLTTSGGWSSVDPSTLKTLRKIEVVADTANVMGSGTDNHILFFQNIATDSITYDTFFSADGLSTSNVLMVSFDFYESSALAGGVIVAVGDGSSAKNPVNEFSLIDGSVGPSGSYSLNTAQHVDVVFNESGSTLEYDGPAAGTSLLATGLMDIWMNQVRVAAGISNGRSATPATQLSSINFRNADTQVEIYFDNVEVFEIAGDVVEPPPYAGELLMTNLVVGAGGVRLDWNQPSDHFIVIAADEMAELGLGGWCVASETTTASSATFSYDQSVGFFRVMTGIAAVDSIQSPVLSNEVKALSVVLAPSNRIYDVELTDIYGMTLTNQAFEMAELAELTALDKLSLSGVEMVSLMDFSSLTNLQWLNLSDNQLAEVSGLSVLSDLQALNLESNQISNLSGIENLTHLRWLDLENNLITDLSLVIANAANGGLGEGDELWVRGNPLSATALTQIQILESTYKIKVVYE